MAGALALLACAAAAAATRYVDYAGGRMPQYGGDYEVVGEPAPPVDDYHGHSPDAPASLDYKYEEEQRSNTDKPPKNADDTDVWKKVRRKQRGVQRVADHVSMDSVGRYSEDNDDHSRVRARRRPRLKDADEVPPPSPRRSAKYSRDRKILLSDMAELDRDDYPDNKRKDLDGEFKLFTRGTTRRVNRRKPRDRHVKRFDVDLISDSDDILEADRRMKPDDDKEMEYIGRDPDRWERPKTRAPQDRYRPVLDDDDSKERPSKQNPKSDNEDYNEYYDMKRVQSIKQNLPALLRRMTTVKATVKLSGGTQRMHELWANRRLGMVPSVPTQPESDDARDAPASDEPDMEPGEIGDLGPSAATTNFSVSVAAATPVVSIPAIVLETNIPSTTTVAAPINASRELSLAEKSKLSILKKAQRKDGAKEESTKKPPVLLQVTEKLATVVMVEPPVSRQPLSARLMSGDSPERLERVKRLMRHKLVAQARNIQELTDHWDDMVCDYIDVSLLDSGAPSQPNRYACVTLLTAHFLLDLYLI